MKIRTKIILFLGATVLFVGILVIAYLHYSVQDSFKHQVVNNLKTVTKANAGAYKTFIHSLEGRTLDWSSDKYIRDTTEKLVLPKTSQVKKTEYANALSDYLATQKIKYDTSVVVVDIVGSDGLVVASSEKERLGVNLQVEERQAGGQYFSKASTGNFREVFHQSFIIQKTDPRPVINVATRLYANNASSTFESLPAVIVIQYRTFNSLNNLFLANDVSSEDELAEHQFNSNFKTAKSYIVNKDKRVVTATEAGGVASLILVNTDPVNNCFPGGESVVKEYVNTNRVNVLGISQCLPEEGIVIINEVDTDEAYAFFADLKKSVLILGFAVVLAFIGVVYVASRRFLKSVSTLTQVSKSVSEGNFAVRVPVTSGDEIGYFSRVFNGMLEHIQKMKGEEEKRVKLLEATIAEKKLQEEFLQKSRERTQKILDETQKLKEKAEAENIEYEKQAKALQTTLIEKKRQEEFLGQTRRAIMNLLDDFQKEKDEAESKSSELEKKSAELEKQKKTIESTLTEKRKQEDFMGETRRAIMNLLEDSWDLKEKAEQQNALTQSIVSSVLSGLIILNDAYKILSVNPKTEEYFGMKEADLVGKDLHEVMQIIKGKDEIVTSERWPMEDVYLAHISVTGTMEQNFSVMTKSRQFPLPAEISAAPLPKQTEGGGVGCLVIITDSTENRKLDEAKSGFISIASHQLRTPLTTIRWYSEMLLSEDAGELNKDQREFLSEIHGGAERLYKTIDLLLGISRVESGKQKGEKTSIDLTLMTEDVAKELDPQFKEAGLTYVAEPAPGDSIKAYFDPILFRQVILNLLSNSIRYTNKGGTVLAKWFLNENNEVVYSVRDNGIGIPVSQQSRIFSKFFRAENALTKVPDGSGLGLALVKDLVEKWGGTIRFETVEGEGTTFIFTIPLSGENSVDVNREATEQPQSPEQKEEPKSE